MNEKDVFANLRLSFSDYQKILKHLIRKSNQDLVDGKRVNKISVSVWIKELIDKEILEGEEK